MSSEIAPPIRLARREDLPSLIALIANAVPWCAADTVWALPWTFPRYRVMSVASQIVAAGSLQPTDDGRFELRGIAIHDDYRKNGLGSSLVGALVDAAAPSEIVCLTQCPQFFCGLGFVETAPTWLSPRRHLAARGGRRIALVHRPRGELAA